MIDLYKINSGFEGFLNNISLSNKSIVSKFDQFKPIKKDFEIY